MASEPVEDVQQLSAVVMREVQQHAPHPRALTLPLASPYPCTLRRCSTSGRSS